MWRFVSSSARWILCYFFVVVVVWLEVTAKWKGLVYNVFIFHLVSRCLRDADSHGWANGVHPRPRSISKAWNSIGLAVVALAAPALARPRQLARHSIASFVTLNRRCASFFPFFFWSLFFLERSSPCFFFSYTWLPHQTNFGDISRSVHSTELWRSRVALGCCTSYRSKR